VAQVPPPAGDSVPGSAASFQVGEAIEYAWNAYWKNVGPVLMITLVIWAIHAVLSLVGFVTTAWLWILLEALATIVGLIVAMGLIRCALAVVKGATPDVGMLFEVEGLGSYFVASILFGVMWIVGLTICIVPGIVLGIMFMFYGYLIVESPSLGPIGALKRSHEITRGHLGELFMFGLALLGINLLGALACFVGLLFSFGITAIAVAYAYRTLNGESVAPVN
jgi:uncharacterized membrane protein